MIVTSLRLWHSQETRHQSEQQNTCQKSKHSLGESSSFHKCELRNKRSKPQPSQAFWTQEGYSSHLKLPQASTSLSTSKSSSRILPSATLRWLKMKKALLTTSEPLSIQPSLIWQMPLKRRSKSSENICHRKFACTARSQRTSMQLSLCLCSKRVSLRRKSDARDSWSSSQFRSITPKTWPGCCPQAQECHRIRTRSGRKQLIKRHTSTKWLTGTASLSRHHLTNNFS